MSTSGLAHNPVPLAALLEQLRAVGVPICCAPETWRLARDGYAWGVAQCPVGATSADHASSYRLLRVLAVRPGSVTLLVRDPKGVRTVLRTLPDPPPYPEPTELSPHFLRSRLLPNGNILARDYLRAISLPAMLDRLPYGRIDRLLALARRLIAALQAVPIVQWLTPSNAFIDAFDRLVFVDATLHTPDVVRNLFEAGQRNPAYFDWIAPEILERGEAERTASLAYSVAALLWQKLLGSAPPKRPPCDHDHIRWRLERELASLGGLPARLQEFLLRNCSPAPEDRFESLGELDATLAGLERSRFKPRGTLVAVRRDGYPWLQDRPRPRPKATLTPVVKTTGLATALVGTGVLLTFALPAELAARAARSLGFTPRALPVASVPPRPAEPELARPTTMAVHTSSELAAAIRSAAEGAVVRLASPGPFTLDQAELRTSMQIVGEEGLVPVLLVTGRYGLRVSAERLELENVHIVVPSQRAVEAAITFSGRALTIRNCSLQTWFSSAGTRNNVTGVACVRPHPELEITLHNVYVRGFGRALDVSPIENSSVRLENVTVAGCGTAVRLVTSLAAGARDAIALDRTTVLGGRLAEVLYQPGFQRGALVELEAHGVLLLPLDRKTPVLAVSYPSAFGQLLSHLSWSGQRVIVPNTARMLIIRFGQSGRAFVVDGAAQWARFWGDVPTGVIGLPLPFAGALPPGAAIRSALGSAVATAGADPARHRVPDVATLAQFLEEFVHDRPAADTASTVEGAAPGDLDSAAEAPTHGSKRGSSHVQ